MRRFLVLVSILAVLPAASLAGSADDNVKLVEAMTEAINVRNFDALDQLIAADVKRHCAATPGSPRNAPRGPSRMVKLLRWRAEKPN